MKKAFQMTDMGLLRFYLGLEVEQSQARITISQGGYALKILQGAGLADYNVSHTPME
jgi:hypothetical protein